jgi:hypothetical protein
MKTLVSTVLAGTLVAATAAGASADPWKYGHPPHPPAPPPHVTAGNVAGAIVAGAFLGYALGSLFVPYPQVVYPPAYVTLPPVYPPYYPAAPYPATPHQAWCINTYGQAYNITTDAWYDVYGVPRQCIAPGAAG